MNRNFKLYNASAGSGKTFTLVKEFLILCLKNEYPSYKNILAVTFANKAASEMKTKILDFLNGIINDDKNSEDIKNAIIKELKFGEDVLKERATRLYDSILHNYSDLRVSTIDSFVQQISRSFANELNLPNQYRLLVEGDLLIDDLMQRINDKINKEDEFLTHILKQFIIYKVNEEISKSSNIEYHLRNFISELFKESAYKRGEAFEQKQIDKQQYEDVVTYLDNKIKPLKTIIDDNVEKIIDFNEKHSLVVTDCYANVLAVLYNKLIKIRDKELIKPDDLVTNDSLREILYKDKKWHSSKIKKSILNESEIDELKSYFINIINCYPDYFLINIVKKNLFLYVLRGTLFGIINQYIEDTNKVHISEFNKRISDVISDCSVPFIYERIGEKFKHFFIDEFQDTSLLQWFNFLPLVNNSMSEGNMNLLVGDAKQAIYRFRNGEVEQIIKLPEIYRNPHTSMTDECQRNFNDRISKEYLKVNYRSKRNIVRFNNSFFRNTRSTLDITSSSSAEKMSYSSVYKDKMEQEYCKKPRYEGGYVNVKLIDTERIVNAEKERLKDKKSETESGGFKVNSSAMYENEVKQSILNDINILRLKGYRLSDITILVRYNKQATDIANFLTDNSIPVISSESILLKSSDKVQLVIYALKYLMNDKNNLIKLSLSHYQNLCRKSDPDFNVQNTFEYSIEKEKLFELRGKAFSIYDLCHRIMKIYNLNVVEDVYLHYFMNLVQTWQSREDNDVNAFLEYWDRKSKSFYVKSATKDDAVEIMTIHKSKGLAFKIVMYPYVNVKNPESLTDCKRWLTFKSEFELLSDMPYLNECILPINKGLISTSMVRYYDEEIAKTAFDEFNIIYVAMTRPKDMLYIYTKKTNKKEPNFFIDYFETKVGKSNHYYAEYDDNDDETYREDFEFEKQESDYMDIYSLGELVENELEKEKDSQELALDKTQSYNTVDWYKIDSFESEPIVFRHGVMDDESDPREKGILIHEILSRINTFEDAEGVLNEYKDDDIIDDKYYKYLLNKIKEITTLKEIKDAYSKDVIIKNEMSILTKNGVLRPDRYAELDDKVIVIDYKTGAPNAKYYKKQQDYMIALQGMGIKKKIEGYLLYIGDEINLIPVYLDRLF